MTAKPLVLRSVRLLALVALLGNPQAQADAVTEWNLQAGVILAEARPNPPVANRIMALVQTAVFEAANGITGRYGTNPKAQLAPGASVEAAVAAANRITLLRLLPAQRPSIEAAYEAALAKVPSGPARAEGVRVGEGAAEAVLARRLDDGAATPEAYRPATRPGAYVPTALPVVPQWAGRRPWLMASPDQFRPGPPPGLDGEAWARDFAEVKALGARTSATRSAEQAEIARFWEATLPSIFHGVVRSVASAPGRELTRNARLFAAVGQACDDAVIAVFDAKYHFGFWRPITAIRNGDQDGNEATERDPSWTPFGDTPMHPEYPCAHCIVASAVATVLRAELGAGPTPTLTTTSPTAGGAARSWKSLDAFVQEVSEARICDGVHYRHSTEVGVAMGRQVGALAVARVLRTGE